MGPGGSLNSQDFQIHLKQPARVWTAVIAALKSRPVTDGRVIVTMTHNAKMI